MSSNTADNDNELAIELDGLTKRFGKTLAVDDISLAVKNWLLWRDYASCIGFVFPFLIFACQFGYWSVRGLSIGGADNHEIFLTWYGLVCVPVAIVCFGLGTWVFLRRREP